MKFPCEFGVDMNPFVGYTLSDQKLLCRCLNATYYKERIRFIGTNAVEMMNRVYK